jgi:TolB-like protein
MESVAVLPFENTGEDPEAKYLSDGITESLINRPSPLPHLKVIARTSVFRYKGKHPDLATVASELGVRAIVSGRVSQRADGFSVAVEPMDARENGPLEPGPAPGRIVRVRASSRIPAAGRSF